MSKRERGFGTYREKERGIEKMKEGILQREFVPKPQNN
jgi:hypothetical protein